MSLKAALTALFAASVMAGKYLPDKEYELAKTRDPALGWCAFHLREDASDSLKIELHLFGAPNPDPKLVFYQEPTEVADKFPYELPYDRLPHKLTVDSGDENGFEFKYGDTKFSTGDESHCQGGGASMSGSKVKEYNCGFTC